MSAVRQRFNSTKPTKQFSQQAVYYSEQRGATYHPVMPIPETLISDNRQLARMWTASAIKSRPAFQSGLATAWKGIFDGWQAELDRLIASKQAPNEVYADNEAFWLASRRLAMQLGAKDQIVTPNEVLVWAVKDTVREHAETVQEAGQAVYQAGKSAVDAVTGTLDAIPTIAKAVAVGAVGLGVYAIAKK